MRHSIRKKYALIFIGLLAGTMVLCWIINTLFLERYYIYSKEQKITYAYGKINDAVGRDETPDVDALQNLNKMCFDDNILAVVIDRNSRPVYYSPNGGDDFVFSVINYRLGGYPDVQADMIQRFYYDRNDTEYLGRFGSMENGNSYLICTPVESIRTSVMLANRFLAYVGAIMAVLGAVVIYFVTKKVTDPIKELAGISERIAALDFEAKYQGKSKGEIALLGDNINKLSHSLEQTISELKTANNELQRDIQKKEELAEQRKEFLANVSHELKTPIALIQGYAEGLSEGITSDPESMAYYCEVIVDEASKMNQMVKKLMTLSQLEAGDDAVAMERFDIVNLVKEYVQSAQILTKQNGIRVTVEAKEPIYVWADEFKTEEVFMNYFTNALNHCRTVEGHRDKAIEVQFIRDKGKVRVSVFNTGAPIPEEALPHLWEKFYKVDKARTREYGGSGVGLSIVKAIMESMNRAYGVNNYEDGVQFWFELEAAQQIKDL